LQRGTLQLSKELDFVVDLLDIFKKEDNPFEVLYQIRKKTEARYYELIA
jgi:hypothetical protein